MDVMWMKGWDEEGWFFPLQECGEKTVEMMNNGVFVTNSEKTGKCDVSGAGADRGKHQKEDPGGHYGEVTDGESESQQHDIGRGW